MAQKCPSQEFHLEIDSDVLKSKTEVKIFTLCKAAIPQRIIYFTDGKKLLDAGFMETLKSLYKANKISPTYLVFVSSVDLNDGTDRRNDFFLCNPDYVSFFEKELIPEVEKTLEKKFPPLARSLFGVSFGGLNSAWFSIYSNAFENFALLSPITYPCPDIVSKIAFSERKKLKIFISTGINDAENYVTPLERIYRLNNHKVQTKKTMGGHNFENWASQLEMALNFFHPKNHKSKYD